MARNNYMYIPVIIIGIFMFYHHQNQLEKKNALLSLGDEATIYNQPFPEKVVPEKVVPGVKMPLHRAVVLPRKGPDSVSIPQSTDITQQLTNIKNKVMDVILNVKSKPVNIIRNKYISKPVKIEEKDTISIVSPNPIDSTEYRFVDEENTKAWSEVNVSQHPSHYTSNIKDELTNTGTFFSNNMQFNDITSPQAKDNLPDRCFMNSDNEVLCNFNNRLHNIPPTLVDGDNQVINSIGEGDGNEYKQVSSDNISLVNSSPYRTWEYEDEKVMNGGELLDGLTGTQGDNEQFLKISHLPKETIYAF